MKINAIVLLLLTQWASAQQHQYYFSYQIDSILNIDSTRWKFQTASWNYSFIGEYKKALEVKDRQFPGAKIAAPTIEQAALFKRFKPIDAKKTILNEAAKTRLLIINEAHHISLHRNYLASLLPELYQLGYTILGLEALGYEDTLLNERGYPILQSGFYTRESCFGNLIREAIKIGFTVLPYEQISHDSTQIAVGREKAQALNIQKIMDRYPEKKLILFCGYDHVAEDTLKNFMGLPMAGQLKQLTGVDPFTIDQTALTEFHIVGNRYRHLMLEQQNVLYTDSISNYFNYATLPKKIDCNLYHPNTKLIHNRPHWLKNNHNRFVKLHKKIKIDYPYLILIYQSTDDKRVAVPLDVIEIKSPADKKASLVLKHVSQVAVIISSKGERQELQIH